MSWGRDSQKQKEGKRDAFTTESHLKSQTVARKKTSGPNKCMGAEQKMPVDASGRAYLPLKRSWAFGWVRDPPKPHLRNVLEVATFQVLRH
jgi:hypothetical protein